MLFFCSCLFHWQQIISLKPAIILPSIKDVISLLVRMLTDCLSGKSAHFIHICLFEFFCYFILFFVAFATPFTPWAILALSLCE